MPVIFGIFLDAFNMLSQILQGLVIVMVVLSLLFSFNVISGSNTFLLNVYQGINRLLDPILNPIRKLLPDTGGMDFSPLVLLFTLELIRRALIRYAMTYL
ncbi:YggT family protein [Novosphingobium sp.]|uniref:YggT family protein n=1 Tax=Novosphingobium sp. TaxID=1874826 RepID=UPI00286DB1B3|nr:YggT family protein [Novosphingobium sp.]